MIIYGKGEPVIKTHGVHLTSDISIFSEFALLALELAVKKN